MHRSDLLFFPLTINRIVPFNRIVLFNRTRTVIIPISPPIFSQSSSSLGTVNGVKDTLPARRAPRIHIGSIKKEDRHSFDTP